jgi:hypothetical protein
MGEQRMPNPNREQSPVGNQPEQFPDEKRQPNERASTPPGGRDMSHDDAARRQSRQDPLQKRDR